LQDHPAQTNTLDPALYLEPNSAFAEVARLAQDQGESFSIAPHTLWRRMGERGLLIDRMEDKRADSST
jgi:hypothetical protein